MTKVEHQDSTVLTDEELRTEFLSMDIALAVVDGVDAAIAHVNE